MHPKTRKIAERIRQCRTQNERFTLLEGAYEGSSAVLFSCGPSFKPESIEALRDDFKDQLVIAIKQTHHTLGNLTDFHLYNPMNHTRYRYGPETISFLTHCPDPVKWKAFGPKPDLEVFMDPAVPKVFEKESDWLVCNRRYSDYLFSKQLERPWGPGIVLESALFFALHLGVTRLACVGWDVSRASKKTQTMEHFYEKETERLSRNQTMAHRALAKVRSWAPKKVSMDLKRLQNYMEYRRGGTYNRPKTYHNENEAVWEGSFDLYQFLRSEGLELEIASDCCWLDERIPRTTIEEFLQANTN